MKVKKIIKNASKDETIKNEIKIENNSLLLKYQLFIENSIDDLSNYIKDEKNDFIKHQGNHYCRYFSNDGLSEFYVARLSVVGWKTIQFKSITDNQLDSLKKYDANSRFNSISKLSNSITAYFLASVILMIGLYITATIHPAHTVLILLPIIVTSILSFVFIKIGFKINKQIKLIKQVSSIIK